MSTLLGNLLTFLFGILLPVWLCFKVRKSYWVLLLLFLTLLFAVFSGMFFLIHGPLILVFGWIKFLIEKLPQITPNLEGIAMALTSLVLLIYGGHWFLRWLYSHWGPAREPDSPRLWPMRWTLSLVALLFLFFSASIGFIGATHQTAWMIGADQSLVKGTGFVGRAYNSQTKNNLHQIFLACKVYWADHSADKSCTREFYTATPDGYVPEAEIVVRAGGNEQEFHAIAGHLKNDRWYWVDPVGNISILELPELNARQKS